MKNGMRIVAALSMAFAGLIGTTAMVNHVAAKTTTQECGCDNGGSCNGGCRLRNRKKVCGSCNTQCGCVQCPQCEEESCKLELDNSNVKKTCFKVEQASVCIPPVRFPWQKCCPPGRSKTRTVTRLKVHSYECPNCAYKWKLEEPTVPQMNPAPTMAAPYAYDQVPANQFLETTGQLMPMPQVQPQVQPMQQGTMPWNANSIRVDGQLVPGSNN